MICFEEKNFVINACQKLQERGWFPDKNFMASAITEQEIVAFEQEHQVKLPSLYKAFLTSFRLPQNIRNSNFICSIIEDKGNLGALWLAIDCPPSMNEVSKNIEILQEIRDFCELPDGCFRNLIPIGDWGDEGRALLKELIGSENPAGMAMRLQRFSVGVPVWSVEGYKQADAVEELEPFLILKEDGCRSFYREDVGLVAVGEEVLELLSC